MVTMCPQVCRALEGISDRRRIVMNAVSPIPGQPKSLADELEHLSTADRDTIKSAIDDIAVPGPKAEAGAARIKRLAGKAGSAVGQAFCKIAVDVASETAKKIMTGV
jgi:hypothetical protein